MTALFLTRGSLYVYSIAPMLAITFTVFGRLFVFMGIDSGEKSPQKALAAGGQLMGDEHCSFRGNDPNKCDHPSPSSKKPRLKPLS